MRITASANVNLEVQGVCAPQRRPDALIVSPLPNVRLEPGAAVVEVVHHPSLEPMNGTGLTGKATVRLRGQELHVTVAADRRVHIDLRRCRSSRAGGAGGDGELLLVVTGCGGSRPADVSSASFDLSMRDGFAELGSEDLARLSPSQAGALGYAALQGLPTRGWLAGAPALPVMVAPAAAPAPAKAPAPVNDRIYFLRRIKDEIRAALRASEPGVASRHVQIATLLARRLQEPA
jgi:hypothetical protein